MASQEEQLQEQVWWLLQELNNLRLLADGKSVLFELADREQASADQQRLILLSLQAQNAVELKPEIWQTESVDLLVSSVSGKQFRHRRYWITLLPGFDSEYDKKRSLQTQSEKPKAEGKVVFAKTNNNIRQGRVTHEIVSKEVQQLVAYLWPKRSQVDVGGKVLVEGKSVAMGVVGMDIALSNDQIKNRVTSFNEQMRTKGINAKITTRSGVILTVEGER